MFREPWEARAFAMVVTLHERGLFTWSEWARTLAAEIKAPEAGDDDGGGMTYHHWLAALETIIADKRIATRETLERHADAWGRAAERTPHGTPIVLTPVDFRTEP